MILKFLYCDWKFDALLSKILIFFIYFTEEELEPPPPLPEKSDLEDELLPDEVEEASTEVEAASEAKTIVEAKPASTAQIGPTHENLEKNEILSKTSTSDRAAASPPCEVSSTTVNNEAENKKQIDSE